MEFAEKNVRENGLEDRITCTLNRNQDQLLLPLFSAKGKEEERQVQYDFCMCNPPFYESWEQVFQSREFKEDEPNAVCLGTENEMVTAGGEVEFAKKLIEESLVLRGKVRWYTTKLGIRASLKDLTEELARRKVCPQAPFFGLLTLVRGPNSGGSHLVDFEVLDHRVSSGQDNTMGPGVDLHRVCAVPRGVGS